MASGFSRTDFWRLTCSSLTQEQCQYESAAHFTKNSLSGRPLSGGSASGSVGSPSGGSAGSGARTQPLPVGDLGQRRVEAVDVVGGRTGVAAQQLPSVFTHPAELQVVVLFLAYRLLLFLLLILSLPLDPLFLLEGRRGRSRSRLPRPSSDSAKRRILRVQADQVVRSGTRVTQDDLAALLADLAVVLVHGGSLPPLATTGGCVTVTVSTAAATAAATAVADAPLNGLLALNSRHLAPNTVIILDMGILGFFLAMRGLRGENGSFITSHSIYRGCQPPPSRRRRRLRLGSPACEGLWVSESRSLPAVGRLAAGSS
ncbi:hypothetical protein EYF80_048569 [Liparis tanakae]|uniref:Uncharacterized protein n=1 Tax=Liparis tanakae TaxID=230148 RepID=A0A4Z2FJX4_9TELE|nr:hypothetical protein EYF80_048569 [Liparis tanakae]